MPLQQAVQGVLSRSTIAADTLDAAQIPEPERAGIVRPVLLADASGKLLVLVASDSLLDLAVDREGVRESREQVLGTGVLLHPRSVGPRGLAPPPFRRHPVEGG